ncbi:MAG: zinc-ribbon domain-containing protein [Candidatus Acidiferrales bacterium]
MESKGDYLALSLRSAQNALPEDPVIFCTHCGQPYQDDATFCSGCGKQIWARNTPVSPAPSAPTAVKKPASNAKLIATLFLICIAVIALKPVAIVFSTALILSFMYVIPALRVQPKMRMAVIGILILATATSQVAEVILAHKEDQRTAISPAASLPKPVAVAASQPKPASNRSNVPPPKFRIYRFKIDEPTSVVVPVSTTDEQLKSLLWLFREKARSHQFKDIGLTQPTAKQWGNKGYLSGMLSVYRGEKCANEVYLNTIGPCGYGEHDDALYQWGIDADPNKDAGTIRVKGVEVTIFDYKDGWQVAPEIQTEMAQQLKAEQEAREVFARNLQGRLTVMGFDINVWVTGEGIDQGHDLALDSEMFKDTATRVEFINKILPQWKKDLCTVGFRGVHLRQGSMFELGKDYSLGCENL